ncbi:MAG: hypothetical protein RBR86_02905 [Pseudobdellovibrionaceae bacterium]|jgi:AcrR family transcriptional regulator|nr:hypothetical protein [Pseudobdellovibrionaceae bacterium]
MVTRKRKERENRSQDRRAAILDAVLRVAARDAWQSVSYWQIAEDAEVSISEVEAFFPSKQDMVAVIVSDLDERVLSNYQVDLSSSKRDVLFDVLMERFDAMADHRDAHISFLKSYGWTYASKREDLKTYFCSLSKYLSLSGIETRGLFGPMAVAAVGLGYLYVLFIWAQDSSPDLAKTMAALDKMLSRLDLLKEYVTTRVA